MMYKHWEKILLAMSTFFWNSCNTTVDETPKKVTKASEKVISKEVEKASISEQLKTIKKDSIKLVKDTGNLGVAVAIYGTIPPPLHNKICTQEKGNFIVKCRDGITCVDDSAFPGCKTSTVAAKYGTKAKIMPKYGTIVSKKKYICDNGKTYTEKEFKKLYEIVIPSSKIVLNDSIKVIKEVSKTTKE